MTKLYFGDNRPLASVKEAMEAAKAARRERFSHEADKRRRLPKGHEAGVQKLRALWETAISNRVQKALKRQYAVNVPAIVEAAREHKRVVISNQQDFQAVTHYLTSSSFVSVMTMLMPDSKVALVKLIDVKSEFVGIMRENYSSAKQFPERSRQVHWAFPV